MGTSRSFEEFGGKARRLAVAIDSASETARLSAARKVEDVFYREAMKSIRGPSLVGKRWGTYSKPAKGDPNSSEVGYKGPVHWFEGGTGKHGPFGDDYTIVSKAVGRTRKARADWPVGPGMFKGAKRRGVIGIGGQKRPYARHPGMRARPFFDRAKAAARPVAARELRVKAIEEPLRQLFQ